MRVRGVTERLKGAAGSLFLAALLKSLDPAIHLRVFHLSITPAPSQDEGGPQLRRNPSFVHEKKASITVA